jgi:hypothetical protein
MSDSLLDNLTTDQLQDLRHRLNQTDESSTVVVPFGPKAFRLATLRLDKLYWSNHPNGDGGNYISKAQALETLQSVISQRLANKNLVGAVNVEEEVATSTAKLPSTASLPLIDIHEEIDEDGKPIRTEAIDITNHLQHLVQAETSQQSANEISPMDRDGDSANITTSNSNPRPMESKDFDKLTARLDELALLEETCEDPRVNNVFHRPSKHPAATTTACPRSKKVGTTGWSKGFLNKPQSKLVETKPKASKLVQPEPSPATTGTTKSVSFGSDQVHEIPKEGNQRPVSDQSLRRSRPIEPEIFTGIVQERPRRKQTTPEGPKRVSKFAQERQQGLR